MTAEPQVFDVALLDEPRVIDSQRPRAPLSPVVVQTAAAAGLSMLAGATAVALVRGRRARRQRRRRGMMGPVLASRSFLIDVHVLGERK